MFAYRASKALAAGIVLALIAVGGGQYVLHTALALTLLWLLWLKKGSPHPRD
jgi:hypothetical protein